jgi:hypothetical protein
MAIGSLKVATKFAPTTTFVALSAGLRVEIVGGVVSAKTENGTAVPELTVAEVLSVTLASTVCGPVDNTPRFTVSGLVEALGVVEAGVRLPSR